MSKKEKIVSTFNKQIIQFAKSLSEKFEDESYLKKGYYALEALEMIVPSKIIELFIHFFSRFKENALSRDINRLKDNTMKQGLVELFGKLSDEEYDVGDEIQVKWNLFDQDERENVWNYLKLFYQLSDMYKGC